MNLSLHNLAVVAPFIALISLNALGQTRPAQPSTDRQPRESRAITGRVVNESGQPLAGALVQARAVNSVRSEHSAVSNQNGAFTVDGLSEASYFIYALLPAYTPRRPPANSVADKGWYLRSITLRPARQDAKPVDATRAWTTVKSGEELSGLIVTLAKGAASLSGKLADADLSSERVLVYLVPVETERADEPLRFYSAPINDKGQVVLNNLAPGRYWVLTDQIPADSGSSQIAKARFPDGTQTRAALRRQGEAGKTQIELKPCQQMVDFEIRRRSQLVVP